MGRLWYMVLSCNTTLYWVGEEDRRKLVSAIPDFRAVVGIPRSTYSAITTKSKMATPRMKKSFFFFFGQYIFYKDGQIANRS